jgi:hypothetical protein
MNSGRLTITGGMLNKLERRGADLELRCGSCKRRFVVQSAPVVIIEWIGADGEPGSTSLPICSDCAVGDVEEFAFRMFMDFVKSQSETRP